MDIARNRIDAKLLKPPAGQRMWGQDQGVTVLGPITVYHLTDKEVISDDKSHTVFVH